MPAWCSSRRYSWGWSSAPTGGLPACSAACAPGASTTTWTTSATPRATTPSSRCWATSASATTSSARPSSTPGSFSPERWVSIRSGSGSPCSRRTMRPPPSGWRRSVWTGRASRASAPTTTSGPWATPAPAARAARSSTTTARRWRAGRREPRSRTGIATWRSGTWCSCSTTATRRGA